MEGWRDVGMWGGVAAALLMLNRVGAEEDSERAAGGLGFKRHRFLIARFR